MKAARFLLARLAIGFGGLIVFSSIMFFAFFALVPGDFSTNFVLGSTAEELAQIRRELGLDRPLWEQWWNFMSSVFRLEFGRAYFGPPVRETLLQLMPWTLTLFMIAMAIGLALGLPLGRRAAWSDHRLSPTLIAAATATSIFPPWLAVVIANVGFDFIGSAMYDRLRNLDQVMWDTGPAPHVVLWWLVGGVVGAVLLLVYLRRLTGLSHHRWMQAQAAPIVIVLLALSLGIGGLLPRVVDLLGYITLPLIALSMTMTGEVTLIVAAAMTGTRDAPYSVSARAKGLPEGSIRNRHAGRATLLPAISRMAASLPYVLGSLVIVETSFAVVGSRGVAIPGVSAAILSFGALRNTPVVVGTIIAIGFVALAIRTLIDLVHIALDPRITAEAALG